MGRALHIALALLRIPHLALSLFAFPLILSIIIVCAQILITGAVVQMVSSSSASIAAATPSQNNFHIARWLIYGSGATRPPLKVCRWQIRDGVELPPDSDCAPDRLDIAIHVPNPESYDVSTFAHLFDGHVDRLHVCETCAPDVIITPQPRGKTSSTARSVFGLTLLFLPYSNKTVGDRRIALHSAIDNIQEALGSVSMHIPEISDAVGISSLKGTLPIAANVALLVIIALWLALRAHRKVLDYFSRNDVLLPLAATCGRNTFYSAIWVLTLLRVGCFLCASIPLMYVGLADILSTNVKGLEFPFSLSTSLVWLVALISTLSFATVIASIAELQHRHALLSVAYRFLPLVGAFLGALVWGGSFILPYSSLGTFRLVFSSLPVVGITPILLAPITNLSWIPMIIHAGLASLALLWMLRRNARWFAAHLEEV